MNIKETAAAVKEAVQRPISRTGVQAGGGGSVAVLVHWLTSFTNIDWNPNDPLSTEIPVEVLLALGGALTVFAAWWMNRDKGSTGR